MWKMFNGTIGRGVSTFLPKEVYLKLQAIAKKERRSLRNVLIWMIEKVYQEGNYDSNP